MARAIEAELSSLTNEFHRASIVHGLWQPAMMRLKKIFNGSKVHFARACSKGSWQNLYRDCDPYYEATFLDPYLNNPFLPYLQSPSPLDVVTDQSIMPKHEFRKTATFNEWYVPQGDHSSIVCKISLRGGQGIFAVQRGGCQPDFDEKDISLLRRLAPSIARSAEIHMRFGLAPTGLETSGGGHLGQIIVDAFGRVLDMNSSAEALLAPSENALVVRKGFLSAGEAMSANALRKVIFQVCRSRGQFPVASGDILIRCEATGTPLLALTIVPFIAETASNLSVSRTALILVQSLLPRVASGFSQHVRVLFELTQKEAEVAAVLVSGRSLQHYASQQRISYETARTHLRNIFMKTATSRQGELVALLNRVMRLSDFGN